MPGFNNDIGMVKCTLVTLDKKYEIHCSCGLYIDFGYMWATAERHYECHRIRFPDHDCDLVVDDAVPLKEAEIQKKIYQGKARLVKTLRVEPGMT